ncbi:MAG: endonuclease/exonuclease/phosphatase family protein [Chthoniobacterales bacterium]
MRIFVCAAFAVFLSLASSLCDESPVVFAEYNIQNWLIMERSEGKQKQLAPKSEASKAAVVASIQAINPDILGVEEVGDTTQVEDFRKHLRDGGLEYPHMEFVEGADKERHVLLLSKYPIANRNSQSNVRFTLDGKPAHMQRGILDVTVQINDHYKLRLLGVHLKSRREVSGYDQALLRTQEAHELHKYIEAILKAEPDTNLLLFGDFNDTKNQPTIKGIMGVRGSAASMEDIFLHDSEGERWTYYWAWEDEYSRIDYLFFNRALKPEILFKKSGILRFPQWFAASDHRPIYTTISPRDIPIKNRE